MTEQNRWTGVRYLRLNIRVSEWHFGNHLDPLKNRKHGNYMNKFSTSTKVSQLLWVYKTLYYIIVQWMKKDWILILYYLEWHQYVVMAQSYQRKRHMAIKAFHNQDIVCNIKQATWYWNDISYAQGSFYKTHTVH